MPPLDDPSFPPRTLVLTTRFINLLEVVAAQDGRRITGILRNSEDVLQPAVLALLEESHDGVFAFLAFHPERDRGFAEYVRSGALAGDTGRHMLALYAVDSESAASTISLALGWNAILDHSIDPAAEMVRNLFPAEDVALPGILVIPRFSRPDTALYVAAVHLDDAQEVGLLCQAVFAAAAAAYRQSKNQPERRFTAEFAARLRRARLGYIRTRRRSFFKWLTGAYTLLWRCGADLVAAAGLQA